MKNKKWPKPSTRAFVREARRTPGYSLFDWIHGYMYARWPYLYIGIGTGEHPLARLLGPLARWLLRLIPPGTSDDDEGATFADTYHGKAVPLTEATQLVTVNEDIRLTDLEQVIPYARARDIVLQNPDHIVALDCPCRVSRANPCLPLDVCLIVGEPFASFIAEHHPHRSRRITPGEAVEILRAEDERGHVHHAFFKDAMLDRFYAICNCCACCCGAMQAHRSGTPMLASSGYVSHVDAELCVDCGLCVDSCQFGALSTEDDVVTGHNGHGSNVRGRMTNVRGRTTNVRGRTTNVRIDTDACMGCGVCVSKCAQGALSLVRAPSKGEPLRIQELVKADGPLCSQLHPTMHGHLPTQ